MNTTKELQDPIRSEWSGIEMVFDVDESARWRPRNANLQLFAQASRWFYKLAIFRQGEVLFFYDVQPGEEALKDHKAILDRLIREADEISRRAQIYGDMLKAENGFTIQDLQAAVEELQTTKLQWHGSMSPDRKNQILSLIADESES